MKKYKIFCETDNKWETVISSNEPTQCPSDNTHTIRNDSVSIVNSNILVNDGTPTNLTLSDYKKLRYNEVNFKSDELIPLGFVYDGYNFKCRLEDRINYGHIHQFKEMLPFPLDISTIDGGVYSLTYANVDAFIGAVLTHVNTILAQGNALKDLINQAVDVAGVDAVVDNR